MVDNTQSWKGWLTDCYDIKEYVEFWVRKNQ